MLINWRKDGKCYWAWFAMDGPDCSYRGTSLAAAIGDLITMEGARHNIPVVEFKS